MVVEAHLQRRRLQHALAKHRQAAGLSQTGVARRMGTSQPAGLEAAENDANVSTLQRPALAIGYEINFSLRPAS